MKEDLEKILYAKRPISKKHPPMSLEARAAQFAPFAALTGHQELLEKTAKTAAALAEDQWEEFIED